MKQTTRNELIAEEKKKTKQKKIAKNLRKNNIWLQQQNGAATK